MTNEYTLFFNLLANRIGGGMVNVIRSWFRARVV